ncbi:MAG: hypothetical protein D3910_03245 [Candidatus Electrothrix sp. ATG2]|nr:hypothetical protein [Candidatus Electrothrix sp. ATG2]
MQGLFSVTISADCLLVYVKVAEAVILLRYDISSLPQLLSFFLKNQVRFFLAALAHWQYFKLLFYNFFYFLQ